jgi:hypothetical protein
MARDYTTCPHCGAENLSGAEWCVRCFAVLRVDPESDSDPDAVGAAKRQEPKGPAYWECRLCGESNQITADRCHTCNAAIYESFGPAEDRQPTVPATTVLRHSMWFPGLGFRAAGNTTLAIAIGAIALMTLAIAVLEFFIDRAGFGILLLVMTAALWAVAARDSYVLASTRDPTEMWLRPRILTLFAAVVGLVVLFTVAEAVRLAQGNT